MNYQEMSDRHINCLVHDVFIREEQSAFGLTLNVVRHPKDYCNSWADAGPIIQRNKISIIHDCMAEPQDGGCWLARPTYGYEHEKARSDNPLRAAMVLFLMMKGGD